MNKNNGMLNLKKIAKARNKSLTSLSIDLEVSQEAISQYISGKIKPKTETIINMAKILNTSTDYLLGLTDNPTPNNFTYNDREYILISNYRKLNDNEKLKVESYIQVMIDFKEDEKIHN